MTSTIDRVFADTIVWVYLVDGDEPAKQAKAREVLASLGGGRLVTSAQVMGEFHVSVTRKLARTVTPEVADRIVERMAALDVVAIDGTRVRDAIDGARTWGISYWDALIVVCAEAAGCQRLLSEDLADGATYGSVKVENPFREPTQVNEAPRGYEARAIRWSDDDLLVELARYEQVCRAAGMRPNAIHSYWDYARRFLAWRTGDYHPRGTATTVGRPVPVDLVDADGLTAQVTAYGLALKAAGRESVTIDTYERHAMFFVRWLRGAFRPGSRSRGRHELSS